MASTCMVLRRGISTSAVCHGKRNFRKFLLYNKRGSRAFKLEQSTNPDCDIPIDHRGVRPTGRRIGNKFNVVPEMVPELIVPSLKDFHLKPYVTYEAKEYDQAEFTAKDLFNLMYAEKIKEDFKKGALGPNGEPLEPSEHERLTPEEAKALAEKTGCDIFVVDS